MKRIGAKKLIIIIGVLLTTLVFSFAFLFTINFVTGEISNRNIQVDAASWSGSGTQTDPYLITNSKTLKALADSVNGGNSHDGEYFELTKSFDYSIDYSDIFNGIGVFGTPTSNYTETYNVQQVFNGHFDGKGNTISGFEISAPTKALLDVSDYSGGTSPYALGFFACLGPVASVENLRLKDFTLNIQYKANELSGQMSYPYVFIGGIAGCYLSSVGTVSIHNCSVEGMKVMQSTGNENTAYVGGLIGSHADRYLSGGLSITNCYLKDLTIDSSLGIYPIQNDGNDAVGALIGCANDTNTVSLADCILTGSNTSYFTEYANGNVGYGVSINANAKNVYLNPSTADQITLSSCSAVGGKNDGTYWYYAKDYGLPCLRSFIIWKTINFSSEDTAKGTVDKSSIEIPSDAFASFSNYDATLNKSECHLTIYEQTINAVEAEGYSFDRWESSISTTAIEFIAYFKKVVYYYKFDDLKIGDDTYKPVCETFLADREQTIEVEFKQDTDYEVLYSATATVIKYNIGDQVVTYTITDIRYKLMLNCSVQEYLSADDNEESEIFITELVNYHNEYFFHNGYVFEFGAPKVELKRYNVTFG